MKRDINGRTYNIEEHAELQGALLMGADLSHTRLFGANFQNANLRGVDFRGADLRHTNFRGALLEGTDLRGARLPSPTILLLADWGEVSRKLTADLMEYDASCHPNRNAFKKWAKGGECPYANAKFERAANFQEDPDLFGKGKLLGAFNLITRLFKQKGIKR